MTRLTLILLALLIAGCAVARAHSPKVTPTARFIVVERCGYVLGVHYSILLDTRTGRQYIQGRVAGGGTSLTEMSPMEAR